MRYVCYECGRNIQGPQTWTDIKLRYIMVRLKDDATDAGGVEETSLPVVDW